MKISIVGLGYVGTVSAACLATKGHLVWGVDVNADKVRMIDAGESPIIETGLGERIARTRRSGRLKVTGDVRDALRESEICFVAVATPSRPNGQLDPAHLFRACEQISVALADLNRPQVLVIRSSVLPSVLTQCEEVCERFAPGLVKVCVNPEFLREGTAVHDFENPSFTLLGVKDAAVELMLRAVYCGFTAPVQVMFPEEALLVKYASNVFHALKVAFANEMGTLCQSSGIDGRAVMSAFCKDTRLNISANYLMPGFAFGGSCLPKDVRAVMYLAKQADVDLPLINSIFSSNARVVDRAIRYVINSRAVRIGLIGLSFKSSTDDLRESPYVEIAERLIGKGYQLKVYDPNVFMAQLTGANKAYIEQAIPHLSRLLVATPGELTDSDLLVTGHSYQQAEAFLAETEIPVLDLTGRRSSRALDVEEFCGLSAAF